MGSLARQLKQRRNQDETNGFNDKIDITYVHIGTDYHNGWGLPVHHSKILSEKIEMVDVFDIGDIVVCDVHRGSNENEDGISSGGKWVKKTGVVTDAYGKNGTEGFVKFYDGNNQSMSLIRGNKGFPGRDIQLGAE